MEAVGVSVGAEGTIRADLGGAEALLTDALRDVLRGLKGSLVTDEASFKRGKAVPFMFASNGLPEAVLLKLVHPDDLGVYDHNKMALDVRAALVRFGMIIEQVFALLLVCCGCVFFNRGIF